MSLLEEIQQGLGLPLKDLAKLAPVRRQGRPVNMATLWRWALRGAMGPAGQKIRLEAVRAPGGWISSAAALTRFFSALTPSLDSEPATRTPTRQKQASDRAARELSKMGV